MLVKLQEWKIQQQVKAEQRIIEADMRAWCALVNTWFEEKGVNFEVGPSHFNTWGKLKPEIAAFEIYRDEFVILHED